MQGRHDIIMWALLEKDPGLSWRETFCILLFHKCKLISFLSTYPPTQIRTQGQASLFVNSIFWVCLPTELFSSAQINSPPMCGHLHMCRVLKTLSGPTHTFPGDVKQCYNPPSFQLSYCKLLPFSKTMSVLCFSIFCSLEWFWLKMASNHSVEVPSSVLMCKKSVMCLLEKMSMLDGLCSGMGYNTVGHELMFMKQ